jgi:flagellar M-ring protein FliF
MQRLTQLVRSAVGFNQARGDVVEVVNARFTRGPAAGAAETGSPGMFSFLGNLDVMRIVEIAAALIAALAFVFFVLRPLIGGLIRGGANAAAPGPTPALAGAGAAAAALPAPDAPANDEATIDIEQINGRVRASSVKKMAEVVNQHPDESVQIIRGWLNNAL